MDDLQISEGISQYGDFRSGNEREQSRMHSTTQSTFMRGFPSSFSNTKGAIDRAAKIVKQEIEDEVSFLQSDISEKNEIIENLRQRRDGLKTGYDALQLNYDTLESRYSDLSAKFDKQKAEKEKAQVGYNQVVGALKKISRRVSDLTQQVADKDKQIEDLRNLGQETLDAKQEEVDRLKKKVRSSKKQANRKKIQDLERQIANKSQEIENLKNSGQEVLASRRKEIENLEEEVRNLNEKVQKLKEKRSMRQETDRQLKQLKSDYETLKNSHGQKEALLEKLENERRDLSAQLDEANRENERLSQELAATRQQLEQAEADLQQTSGQLQQLYDSFNNIKTADKQEVIAYLKGLSRLIQDGQFPADKIHIVSTSGIWDGEISSPEDIQYAIDYLELEFAKDQGPDYCVNQIINEMMQPEIVDPDGSLARINLFAKACREIDAQFAIGKAVVRVATQRSISIDPTYRDICQIFGQKEAQEMAVSVFQDQSIVGLCRKANTCFGEKVLNFDSAAKLFDVINSDIPTEISQCFKAKICEKWGRQIIDRLKNGQDDEAVGLLGDIRTIGGFGPEYLVNLEADDVEKRIKDLREGYASNRECGELCNELDEAVKNMRNFRFDTKGEISCDEIREALFNSFDFVLQVLARWSHIAGKNALSQDITNLFDLLVKKSESFQEKIPFQDFTNDGDMCQRAFDFASKILPNIHKFRIDSENENFVTELGEHIPFSTGLPSHLQMFEHLQRVIRHYTDQVTNKLNNEKYKHSFHELLTSFYTMKVSDPSAITGLMRLSEICKHYYTNDTSPVDILSQVDDNDNNGKVERAYLLAELSGKRIDPQNRQDVEVANKIIDIANETETERKKIFKEIYTKAKRSLPKENDIGYFLKNDPSENWPFFLDALKKSVKRSNIRRDLRLQEEFGDGEEFKEACKMCDIYNSGRELDEAHRLHPELSLDDVADFVSQKYYTFRFNRDYFKNLESLGLSQKSIRSIKEGQSPFERASQKAKEWNQRQLTQSKVDGSPYYFASHIKEAVDATNAGFWYQVGDSLIDIGREFCEVLKDKKAPAGYVNSIRDYFYALIRECETNGGGVGIIPQTLPF